MLIHGGGWTGAHRERTFRAEAKTALIFRRLGYQTVTVDYRGGADGLIDVQRAYDITRHRDGARLPICAIGTSAGGTLALLLAAHRPTLRCVISLAGPTDLSKLRTDARSHIAYELAVRAFGRHNLARYSPIRYAHRIRARLLLVYASNDPVVPAAQGTEMARADRGARLIILPPGNTTFVHSRVSTSAAHRAEFAELRFLNAATATP